MRKATRLLAALSFLIALPVTPLCFAQAQLFGEWSGTLSTPGGIAHILWHVVKAPDGSATCSFDNVEEGVLGIKVKSLTVKGSEVTVVIDDVIHPNGQDLPLAGTYVGTLSKDGNAVAGIWSQTQPNEEQPVELTFKRDKAATAAAPSPQVAGDWHGTLSASGAELRLVFHFVARGDETLGGTLDSVDQGANEIPITSATLRDSKLSLVVDAVHGTYEGTVSPDATAIKGTWSQGTPLELNLERGPLKVAEAKPAPPSEIDGTWQGTLDARSMKLRLIYKIENTADGLTAKMQSPDQSPAWTLAYPITRSGSSITIPIKANGSTYEGKFSADLSSIDGTFQQAGQSFPLSLKRVKE